MISRGFLWIIGGHQPCTVGAWEPPGGAGRRQWVAVLASTSHSHQSGAEEPRQLLQTDQAVANPGVKLFAPGTDLLGRNGDPGA